MDNNKLYCTRFFEEAPMFFYGPTLSLEQQQKIHEIIALTWLEKHDVPYKCLTKAFKRVKQDMNIDLAVTAFRVTCID